MHNYKKIGAIAGVLVLGLITITLTSIGSGTAQEEERHVVMDSATVLLDWKVIPAKDFIHLYDSTPARITAGHVAAKLPCDANGESPLVIVAGVAPDVKPADMELVGPLSSPGTICIYHADLPHEDSEVTDVALLNPTDKMIRLPRTSTVVISVSEIMSGMPHAGEHGGHE
jgi:hypothetical protein